MDRDNAKILNENLAHFPALRLTLPPETIQHAYYKYYVFLRPELLKPNWNRDHIMQAIMTKGIPCFSGSCSEIYQEQAFIRANLQPRSRLPIAKNLGETSLMFLVHPTLTADDMQEMATGIQQVIREASIHSG